MKAYSICCWIFIILLTFCASLVFAQETSESPATPSPDRYATAKLYFDQAKTAFRNGELENAEELAKNAVAAKPDWVEARYLLGRVYLFIAAKKNRLGIKNYGIDSPEARYVSQYIKGREELKKGAEQFRAAISLQPNLADAWLNLAICQDNLGQEEEAIKSYEKAIELDPNSTNARDAYNNLGLVYTTLKDYKKAKESYEKSLALDASFAPAKLNLQRLLDQHPKLK